MANCLIGLGANLGDRAFALRRAIDLLAEHPRIRVVAVSSHRETAAVGGPAGQPPFLNAAAHLETDLAPKELLAVLGDVESRLGRRRAGRWDARTIDLDLLLYADCVLDMPGLRVPHPRMTVRRFVLAPAAEIAPLFRHPESGWTVEQHLRHLQQATAYVALAGPIGAGKTTLAEALARTAGIRLVRETIDETRLAAFYADRAGQALATELEFVRRRALVLDSATWTEPDRWAVSDFWFDQSRAFAETSLLGGAPVRRNVGASWGRYEAAWRASRETVMPPKLIVVLDAPNDVLLARIRGRGRPYERSVDAGLLDVLRGAIVRQARQPNLGPVLWIDSLDAEVVREEVTAALSAMG
jgi:2-amino-4-hydroxy-6-hydroxymethyldihydropteridine diphosphokinase